MFNLILNSTNLVSNTNNTTFRYAFPVSKTFQNHEIAVASVAMYYSWFNISASLYNNNSFSYTWFDASGNLTNVVTVTLPDGNYSVSEINTYMQYIMSNNGHYLINSTGSFVYYLDIVVNSTSYNVNICSYAMPVALPSGYTKPTGSTWTFPSTAKTPYITISTNNFGNLIGFTSTTSQNYPSSVGTSNVTLSSNVTPQISPVQMLVLNTNLVNNQLSPAPQTIYALTAGGTTFGNLVTSVASQFIWNNISPGTYQYIEIKFYDQNYNNMVFQDSDILVMLLIKEKGE